METIFDKIKKDVKKGLEEGIAAVMQGANVLSVKMNELSEEGKKQYKMFNLHVKIKDRMDELGGIAYAVLESGKNLDEDKKIKAAYNKIKKLQWQLSKFASGPTIKSTEQKKPVKKAASKTSANKSKVQSK